MSDLTIAKTILNQLGGQRFILMTGSKDFVGGNDYLQFKVGRNLNGISHVKIIYNYGKDLYTAIFMKWNGRKMEFKEVAKFEELYCEDLTERFVEQTGLLTRL